MTVRSLRSFAVAFTTMGILALTFAFTAETAGAATPPVGLGTATSYAVLAGSEITNTGASVLTGDRGLSPGTAVSGFPPGLLVGASNTGNAEALEAQNDLAVAYVDAAGRTPATAVPAELGGSTFGPGTYVGATLELTGAMTLDAGGDPDAVFLFKTNSTLITASNSAVELIGSADPCNVYWQVSSSATLGTDTDFVGTIMALTSITANNGADVTGRLLARNGAVTLDENVITSPSCETLPPGSTTTTTSEPVSTTGPGSSTTLVQGTTTSGPVSTTGPGSSTTVDGGTSETTRPDRTEVTVQQGARGSTTTTEAGSSTTGTSSPRGPLPRTGSNLGVLVGIGLLTLGAGFGILALRRQVRID